MKRIIVDTSTGCLDYYPNKYDIRQIRILLYFDDKKYQDGLDMKADEFYDRLLSDEDIIPKTSQPSCGDLISFFENLYQEGYEEAIVTTLSSQLSGTYNGISLVAKELEDKIKIYTFDTKTVCFPEGLFALEAAKMTESGKSVEEILSRLEEMRSKVSIYFVVDSLKYLIKNGRLSNAAGFVASMLKIKPLLEVQRDGTIVATEKIRTIRRALDRVVEKYIEATKGKKAKPYIVYTKNIDLKNELKKRLINNGIEDFIEVPCTPIVGCHVGPDAMGIGFFIED